MSELTWIMQASAGVHLRWTCAWLIGAMVRSVEQRTVYSKNGAGKVEFRIEIEQDVRDCAADRGTAGQSKPSYRRSAYLRGGR